MEKCHLLHQSSDHHFEIASSLCQTKSYFHPVLSPRYTKLVNYLCNPLHSDKPLLPLNSARGHGKTNPFGNLLSKLVGKSKLKDGLNDRENILNSMMSSIFTISQNEGKNSNSSPQKDTSDARNKLKSSSSDEKTNTSYYSVSEKRNTQLFETSSKNLGCLDLPSSSGTRPKAKFSFKASGGSSSDDVFLPQSSKLRQKALRVNLDRRYKLICAQTPSSESDDQKPKPKSCKYSDSSKLKGFKNKRHPNGQDDSAGSSRSKSTLRPKGQSAQETVLGSNFSSKAQISSGSKSRSKGHSPTKSNKFQDIKSTRVDNESYSTIENAVFLKRIDEVLSEIVEEKKNRILERKIRNSNTNRHPKDYYGSFDKSFKPSKNPESKWVLSKHYDTSEKTNSFSHIITSHGCGKLKFRSKSSDLIDTHRSCFSKLEPYKPRILKKSGECKILNGKASKQSLSSKNNEANRSNFEIPANEIEVERRGKEIREVYRIEDKSGDSTTELNFTSNNTETDDTCYESEQDESGRGKAEPIYIQTRSHVVLIDPAEASVDSAYTGSRGPTPDDHQDLRIKSLQHKLHHRERHLQHKAASKNKEILNTDEIGAVKIIDVDIGEELIDRVRREIICEIRDVGVYSRYAIETLIQLYRRKYKTISKKDMDIISREIYEKFNLGSPRKNTVELPIATNINQKSLIKYPICNSKSELSVSNVKPTSEREVEKPSLPLPEEAVLLKEVLVKSKDESVRWMSSEEVKDARLASEILSDGNVLQDTKTVLGKATTWEDVSKVLPVLNSDLNQVSCGHEIPSNKSTSSELINECNKILESSLPYREIDTKIMDSISLQNLCIEEGAREKSSQITSHTSNPLESRIFSPETTSPNNNSRFPNTDSRIPNIDSRIPNTDSRIPNIDLRIPNIDSRIPNIDSRIPNIDSRIPNADSRIPNIDSRIANIDSRIPNIDSRIPNIDSRIPNIDSRIPNIDSRIPNIDSGIPNIDSGIPNIDSGIPNIDSRSPNIDSRSPNIDSRSPNIDSRSPNTDSRRPNTDSRSPNTDSRSPNTDSRISNTDSGNLITGSKDPGFYYTNLSSDLGNITSKVESLELQNLATSDKNGDFFDQPFNESSCVEPVGELKKSVSFDDKSSFVINIEEDDSSKTICNGSLKLSDESSSKVHRISNNEKSSCVELEFLEPNSKTSLEDSEETNPIPILRNVTSQAAFKESISVVTSNDYPQTVHTTEGQSSDNGQASIRGKISSLAESYADKSEDLPEWLSVADEVCKQFDISI